MEYKTKTHEFKLLTFLSNTFICAALHTSLISCVLIPYTKSLDMLPLQISLIITMKRVVRLIGDTFFGLIFDRFGGKKLFIIGRLMKLFCYLLLLVSDNFYILCLTMIIYGLSEGTIQGKISSFIYNNLKANNKISFFPRAMSLYYLFIDGHLALMNFLAGILIKISGYNFIIKISIIMNIVSLFLILKLIPNNNQNNLQQFVSKSFKEVFNTTYSIIKNNHVFGYIIAIYGILVFFAWQFGSIASMILLDMGFDGTQTAIMGSVVRICTIVGTIIALFFFKNVLKLNTTAILILILTIIGFISAILYNLYLFCIFMMLVDTCYVVLEISLEKKLEFFSNKTIRGTAVSLAMTCCNFISVLSNLAIGLIAQYSNYKIAFLIIMIMAIIFCTFCTFKIIINTRQ